MKQSGKQVESNRKPGGRVVFLYSSIFSLPTAVGVREHADSAKFREIPRNSSPRLKPSALSGGLHSIQSIGSQTQEGSSKDDCFPFFFLYQAEAPKLTSPGETSI